MPKRTQLDSRPIPIRIDPATDANVQAIIDSGLAADRSAALRAAAAALARGLVSDPRVWVVSIAGRNTQLFATSVSAAAWLESQGAMPTEGTDEWYTTDEDGEPHTWYSLEGIVPK